MDNSEPIFCCDELINCSSIEFMITEPFQKCFSKPTFYFFDDGRNGGCYKIKYCPFCGKLLKYKK